jgi:hypothetical protein
MTYLATITPWATSTTRGLNRPELYCPAGVYRVSTSIACTVPGLVVRGDGPKQTVIAWYGGNTPVFDIGAFTTTPSGFYIGTAAPTTFRDLRIQNSAGVGVSGSRTGQAIRHDSGSLQLRDVDVYGFAYGINAPYGGDFNNYQTVLAEYCDVGFYQGPAGQQFYTSALSTFRCREGMVLDRPAQMQMDLPTFVDSEVAALVIEVLGATTTRQVTIPATATYQQSIVLDSPWFEGDAGLAGDQYIPTHFIECNVTAPDAIRDIEINNPYIMAGESGGKVTTSFFANTGTQAAQRVHINRPVVSGTMTQWLTAPSGTTRITDYRVANGYTAPAMADTANYTVTETAALRSRKQIGAAMGFTEDYKRFDDTDGIQVNYAAAGIVKWAFRSAGSWLTRFGVDIQNRRLFLGDPSANEFSIGRSATMPASGTYAIGSFVYNIAPTVAAGKTLLGWQRLTTGTGHVAGTDWSPCYVTNS